MKKNINQAGLSPADAPLSSIAPRVLLVDDDVELTELLGSYLERDGFAVHAVHNAQAGIDSALNGCFDIAVLDFMMPRSKSGLDALNEIRGASALPLIMLTGKGDDVDRIIGLEKGADDYITKPCTSRELAARIRAVLRRTNSSFATTTPFDDIIVNGLVLRSAARSVTLNGRVIRLTSTEYSLLLILAKNVGGVVDKTKLSQGALGRHPSRYDRSIDVHISSIRRKLEVFDEGSVHIETIFGRGYQLLRR
ncbi:response regulator transcription factor [Polynucleobacter sp. Fuers-14]|uniref:response regulator transcription factor n=1 Tax=Polynucleobacter sp. Fuers-14 TaxID=1758364 RepID=UPI001C0C05A1|nr:response regulator transcription factor [Polynucleobacter sp. Fuers-14]MBU3641978.1 response regulator transcription factor [Polynucleobacter sp. Fuers-14]